ncbi:MAG TPA: TlpA family protein disulfide reductase [Gammaproteobacteria bacterium]|nr:TlpA family protein disulfide reductase [Gammaproteobacteria bacterium]
MNRAIGRGFTLFLMLLFIGLPRLSAAVGVGDKAPVFSLTTLAGEPVRLTDYLGRKPVYLVFWATWCPNCLKEIPEINALQARFAGRMAVLAINVGINDSVEAARKYQKEHGMQYPVLFDSGSKVSSAYRIAGTPTQLLIGADGVVRYRSAKTPAAEDIEERWSTLGAAQ